MALYLPRKWSADNSILAIAGVPATSLTRALLEFSEHFWQLPGASVVRAGLEPVAGNLPRMEGFYQRLNG